MGNLAHTPWKNIRTFLLVVRLGSFQKTAEALFITPSAVSQQIQQLEQFFKTKLLNRNAKKISLTSSGKTYYYQVNEIFKKIEDTTEAMINKCNSNIVRVSASVSFNMYFLIPNLFKFEEKYPDIKVNIHTESKPVDQVMEFSTSQIDLAIHHLKEKPKNLVSDKIFTNEIFPVCAPSIKQNLTDGNIWQQIKDQEIPLVDFYAGKGQYDWENWFKKMDIGKYSDYSIRKFKYISHAQQAALSGLGVCLARSLYVKECLSVGKLVTLTKDKIPSEYSLYLVAPSTSYERENCRIFREWILDTFCIEDQAP